MRVNQCAYDESNSLQMNHNAYTETIQSREDFLRFLRLLADDLKSNPDSWENANLPRFLEALAAWIEDMDGYYLNQKQSVPEKPDWQVLRDMFMAARVYE